MRIPIYILAGGRSRRFGSDKARALLRGVPLIVHVAEGLACVASRVVVIADAPGRYVDLGLETIADHHAGLGPLGGIETALLHAAEEWVLICSCDFAGVRAQWITTLLKHRELPATAFRTDRWEPMPSLFHCTALPAVQRQIAGNDHSLQTLLTNLNATAVAAPSDWPLNPGVNTLEELDRVERSHRDTRRL